MKEIAKKSKLLEPLNVNNVEVKKDHYFSNAYTIDLPLDSTPDHVWQDIFEREWKLSRQLWERKLFLVGHKLRLVTTPIKIREKLDWVREIIEQTNKGIDQYNRGAEARVAQREEAMRKRTLKEDKANIEKIKDALRKRAGAF